MSEFVILQCVRCKRDFPRKAREVSHRVRGPFCSRACGFRPKVTRSCEKCGTSFSATAGRVERGAARFCSKACFYSQRPVTTRDPARIAKRFWPKVNFDGPIPAHRPELGACHIWTGAHEPLGRGQLRIGGRKGTLEYAHRVAFFLQHGRWPEPCCLHKCDGGAIGCVRWDHLFEGTKRDNTRDMLAKGRHRTMPSKGEKNGYSKLTAAQVVEIRASRGITDAELGARYGVHPHTVYGIRVRRSWRHIA